MSKPLAEHGTTARAIGRPAQGIKGCGCPACRCAKSRYNKRRLFLATTGRPLTVDATPVANHIDALFAAGAGWSRLANETGCSKGTLSNIRRGNIPRIHRSTAVKILAVQPGDAQPAGRRLNPTGTRRRIQALMAIGHGPLHIATISSLDATTIHGVLRCRYDNVAPHVAHSIAVAYRKLAATPGNSSRARARATNNGWHGPLAWDENIDDPTAEPETEPPLRRADRLPVAATRAEEIAHLSQFNVAPDEIATRVGVSVAYVRDQLRGDRLPGTRNQKHLEAA